MNQTTAIKAKILKGKITRACNKIEEEIESMTIERLEEKVTEVKHLKSDLQVELDILLDDSLNACQDEKQKEEFVDAMEEDEWITKAGQTIADMKTQIREMKEQKPTVTSAEASYRGSDQKPKLTMPSADIPKFDSKMENYPKFMDNFVKVTDKYKLDSYDRFVLLAKNTSGRAKEMLESLSINETTFEAAKKLLDDCFADKLDQQFQTIKFMAQLNMQDTTPDFLKYIAQIRSLQTQLEEKEITVDLIFQYFVWNGANEKFRDIITTMTNTEKPSSKQILDNAIAANKRYVRKKGETLKSWQGDSEVLVNAVAVNTMKEPKCSLCSYDKAQDTAHKLYRCTIYKDAKARIKKLEEINGCTKCGLPYHMENKCAFKLSKPCPECKKWHVLALCPALKQNRLENTEKVRNVKRIAVTSGHTYDHSGTFLPSLTLTRVEGETIRAFRDNGSQMSFIEGKVEDFPEARVLKYETYAVRGFNETKNFKAPLVEIPVKIQGQGVVKITAACIPDVNIGTIDPPDASDIVKRLKKKGYKMADSDLGKRPERKITLLLGNDNAHVLPPKAVVFQGNENQPGATMLETTAGVMLCDTAENYGSNIEALKHRNHQGKQVKVGSTTTECIDDKIWVTKQEIDKATEGQLKEIYEGMIDNTDLPEATEENECLIEETLQTIEECPISGRLIMHPPWKHELTHMLTHNFGLAKSILKSNKKRLSPEKILQYDQVIQEQLELGVIEKIDLTQEKTDETISFLPHSAVFREASESTKCRVVYLANLKEGAEGMSHNQVSRPGINLNHKIQTALLLQRFDKFLVTFDIKKAFLQLMLPEEDTKKLRFLWFQDVSKNNFALAGFKITRVPFGMRYSPFLLMIALYYLLIQCNEDAGEKEKEIRKAIYDLAYVDNLGYSSDNPKDLTHAIDIAEQALNPHGFHFQQFASNAREVQEKRESAELDDVESEVKLLGITWDTRSDEIKTRKMVLDENANTCRKLLKSINSNFDPMGINLPTLNRAKRFMHDALNDTTLTWDTKLSTNKLREWKNICMQLNNAPELTIPRTVGGRSQEYALIVFCDASKDFIGCVLYLRPINSQSMNFVLARNKILSAKTATKSMPILELLALKLGVETAVDYWQQLTGAVQPINVSSIHALSDSSIVLNWLKLKEVDQGKIDKKSVLVNNNLNKISECCNTKEITFHHISGCQNPADCVTRDVSTKRLQQTTYLKGPEIDINNHSELSVTVPYIAAKVYPITQVVATKEKTEPVIRLDRFSTFNASVKTMMFVYKFLDKKCWHRNLTEEQLREKAIEYVLKQAQMKAFPQVYDNLQQNLMTDTLTEQLNLEIDGGIIRVQAKIRKIKDKHGEKCPILLHKSCPIAKAIIWGSHLENGHSGLYKTLALLRKEFWITSGYATVRKILKDCMLCQKTNNRSPRINQNGYRDWRADPETIPFRNVAIDHCGPFTVSTAMGKQKRYLLVITCMWSRAVNILVCNQMTADSFVRALQVHIYDQGVPSAILSDNGSPIVAGIRATKSYLEDEETKEFLLKNNIKTIDFMPYPAGASQLGGLVESMIKQVKNIITKTIRKNILEDQDFELLVKKTIMLVNKRPIAFKNSLTAIDADVDAITPEMILKGREVTCVNILPPNNSEDLDEVTGSETNTVERRYEKLAKAREKLTGLYQGEFMQTLISQAVDKKGRYKKRSHKEIRKNDVIGIKSNNLKPINYPIARVMEVEKNSLDEVTAVRAKKGNGEVVRRHISDVIPLLTTEEPKRSNLPAQIPTATSVETTGTRKSQRKAARDCQGLNTAILADE